MNGWDAIALASIGVVCTVGLYRACKDIFKPSKKRSLNFSAIIKEKPSLAPLLQKKKPEQAESTGQDKLDRDDRAILQSGQFKLLKTNSR